MSTTVFGDDQGVVGQFGGTCSGDGDGNDGGIGAPGRILHGVGEGFCNHRIGGKVGSEVVGVAAVLVENQVTVTPIILEIFLSCSN